LIHCIGRKPWMSRHDNGRIGRFLIDLADDVSPYVLASRRIARDLDMAPEWIEARTSLGAMLRGLTGHHPGMAGFPLAVLHAFQMNFVRWWKVAKGGGQGSLKNPKLGHANDKLSKLKA
jgi:hypothetical protein